MSNLWLGQGTYPEWIANEVFTLRCCEMYGCLPSELAGEDYETVLAHRLIRIAEDKYRAADAQMRR